jgi:hypothetical protein
MLPVQQGRRGVGRWRSDDLLEVEAVFLLFSPYVKAICSYEVSHACTESMDISAPEGTKVTEVAPEDAPHGPKALLRLPPGTITLGMIPRGAPYSNISQKPERAKIQLPAVKILQSAWKLSYSHQADGAAGAGRSRSLAARGACWPGAEVHPYEDPSSDFQLSLHCLP